MSAPRKALIVTVALTLSVIGLKFLVPLVAPIIPADRPHEFANGLGIRLLSIGHEGNRVTWYNEIRNGTGSDITLNLTSTCRHGRPPQESGPSGTSLEGAESIVIPWGQTHGWSESCPSPDSGRWWVYTMRLSDPTGEHRFPPLTLAGRAH
ncbi:hypothetical protein [Nocardiopsis sp. NPDC006832]|uniref:hypothetical protein n=1 Tax=Nocardiopsis sp. NPDC006832 TaxID=3157188 RepID=UPI0033F64774